MAGVCPAPGPDDPLVRSLLGVVDCNVQGLVHGGYSALFEPYGSFSGLLTGLLTIYVAIMGYRLMLGHSQLSITELAMTVVKLGAVIALATQWNTYQTVVYNFLFRGPEQLADLIVKGVAAGSPAADGPAAYGDVFDRLQRVLDQMTAFAGDYSKHAPSSVSPMLGGAGFGAFGLTIASSLLLLSSVGVLLAAKIVLGMLLAVGPVFIALLLFDVTRGIFEGWLRASLAFAFAPLAATLLLGVSLTMIEPSLQQLADLRAQNSFALGPVYSLLTLILVFAGVSLGALIAGGMVAGGLRLPARAGRSPVVAERAPMRSAEAPALDQPRATRIAFAAAAMDRRDAAIFASQGASDERRSTINLAPARAPANPDRGFANGPGETRLGQLSRRLSSPRAARRGARSAP